MKTILTALKVAVLFPFYLVVLTATVSLMLGARVIDLLFPSQHASVLILQGLVGYNESKVDFTKVNETKKLGSTRIYR